MSVTSKVKMLLANANKSTRALGEDLGISKQAAAQKMYNGLFRIEDLIEIVTSCDGTVYIESHDGVKMDLTTMDVAEDKANRETRTKYTRKK